MESAKCWVFPTDPQRGIAGLRAAFSPSLRQVFWPCQLPAFSATVVMGFEGVGNDDPVGSYYSGVSFSSNALGLIDKFSSAGANLGLGGAGLFENEPSPSTIMYFQNDETPVTLDYADWVHRRLLILLFCSRFRWLRQGPTTDSAGPVALSAPPSLLARKLNRERDAPT